MLCISLPFVSVVIPSQHRNNFLRRTKKKSLAETFSSREKEMKEDRTAKKHRGDESGKNLRIKGKRKLMEIGNTNGYRIVGPIVFKLPAAGIFIFPLTQINFIRKYHLYFKCFCILLLFTFLSNIVMQNTGLYYIMLISSSCHSVGISEDKIKASYVLQPMNVKVI
jgi:hypothetical protein